MSSPSGGDSSGEEPSARLHDHLRAKRSEIEENVARARADLEQRNERIKARTGRDLIVATLIGLAIGLTVLGSLIFVKWLFVVVALVAAVFGVMELSRALTGAGRRVDLAAQLTAGVAMVVIATIAPPWALWVGVFAAVAFLVVWRLVAQMARADGRTYGDVVSDVLVAILLFLYVPFIASLCMVLLREDGGEWWVLSFIVVAVAVDTGAYAAGVSFGRHPMAPRISPKKTWEGFAGAALAAIIAGVLLAILLLGLPWWVGVVFGILILGTATLGDLGESMIKRDLGIKDMSSWLPGHGGVLDRLDSILVSVVAALAMYYWFSPLVAS